jgi:hypothetical protein
MPNPARAVAPRRDCVGSTDRFAEALFERFSAVHASTPFERHGGGQP